MWITPNVYISHRLTFRESISNVYVLQVAYFSHSETSQWDDIASWCSDIFKIKLFILILYFFGYLSSVIIMCDMSRLFVVQLRHPRMHCHAGPFRWWLAMTFTLKSRRWRRILRKFPGQLLYIFWCLYVYFLWLIMPKVSPSAFTGAHRCESHRPGLDFTYCLVFEPFLGMLSPTGKSRKLPPMPPWKHYGGTARKSRTGRTKDQTPG